MTHSFDRSFDFIPFPDEAPSRAAITGHDRLYRDRYHGSLALHLTALTPVFISSGITALGSDVGESVPLLKVMGQSAEGYPILQGTSIKGCVRSVYETITNSNVGAGGVAVPDKAAPRRKVAKKWDELSPAELVFGTMGFQGLVSIADAVGDRPLEIGYLPAMFQPRSGSGRKFYHHQPAATTSPSTSASQSTTPEQPPSPIQQAPVGTIFTTRLQFRNLTLAQVGAILIALGHDPNHRFALKLGAGKGKGMGSIDIAVDEFQMTKGDALTQSRYMTYGLERDASQGDSSAAMASAHQSGLIHADQLARLQEILHYPEVTS